MNDNPPITNAEQAEKHRAAQNIHVMSGMKAGEAPTRLDKLNKLGAELTAGQGQLDVGVAKSEARDVVADAAREKSLSDIEQSHQNIRDQEALNKAIEDQKNELFAMNIGITEDMFADEQRLKALEETGQFQSESQLLDLARSRATSQEEYKNMLQQSKQLIAQKEADDQNALKIFELAKKNEAIMSEISKNEAMAEKFRIAEAQAKENAEASAGAQRKKTKMIGAATAVAGAVAMYYTGGMVGGNMVASGTQSYANA
jgi:hypothetical protein